jgi:hypothetical protein
MSNITVNRGWLKKQIIAGNIEIKTSMILTDDYAADAASNFKKSEWAKADIANFDMDDDFNAPGGRAWWNDEKTEITWKLCANNYYKCRIIKK